MNKIDFQKTHPPLMIAVGVTSLALAIGAIAIPLLSHFGVLFPFELGMLPACGAAGGGVALFALGCVALAYRKIHLTDKMISDLMLGEIDAYSSDPDFFRAEDQQGRTPWSIAIQENCPAAARALIKSGQISRDRIEHAIYNHLTVELLEVLIPIEKREQRFLRAMGENRFNLINSYLKLDPKYWNKLIDYQDFSIEIKKFIQKQKIPSLADITDQTPTWQVIRAIFTTLQLEHNQAEERETIMKLIDQRKISLTVTKENTHQTLYGRLVAKGWLSPKRASQESLRLGFRHAQRLPKRRIMDSRPSPEISSIPPINDPLKKQTYQRALNQATELLRDHSHFLHSQSGSFAVLVDFITETEVPSISRAFHPTLAKPHKRFRAPQHSRQFASSAEFVASEDAGDKHFNNYLFRDVLLSVDADFRSTAPERSALYFFKENGSQKVTSAQETKELVAGLVNNRSMRGLLQQALEDIQGSFPHNRLYVISIPDKKVPEMVYPAHTAGVMCQKTWNSEETLTRIKEANDLTKGPSHQKCCDDIKLQYRIVVPLLDEDQDTKVYAFDSMIDDQKQAYESQIRAVGRWARAAMRLESITEERGASVVLDALRRLPFFEHSKIQEPKDVKKFELAIEEIIKEKQDVLKHYASVISENRGDFPQKVVNLLIKNSIIS